MSTRYYGLPTVDDSATLNFVDSVNGLANSTDAVLHGVAASFDKQSYDLPTATGETLGGVRIGDGFKVYSDGLLTTSRDPFELTPATAETLGGVAIGRNVNISDGKITVGDAAFDLTTVSTSQLAPNAVTTAKLGKRVVEAPDGIEARIYNAFNGAAGVWTNAEKRYIRQSGVLSKYIAVVYKIGLYSFVVGRMQEYASYSGTQLYVDTSGTVKATPSALGIDADTVYIPTIVMNADGTVNHIFAGIVDGEGKLTVKDYAYESGSDNYYLNTFSVYRSV